MMDIDPELALNGTTNRFINRFLYVEKKAKDSNKELKDRFLDLVDVVCFNIYPAWYAQDKNDEKPLTEIVEKINMLMKKENLLNLV
jgi:uncharacterized protein YabN with tetrapyrrole methylase and pyrophosphatase domain